MLKIDDEEFLPKINVDDIFDRKIEIGSLIQYNLLQIIIEEFIKRQKAMNDKISTLENSLCTSGRAGSKSNSFHMSDDNNTITSKNDVKNYLKEVKSKLEPERFKKFITQIKALTKNKNNKEKNLIILQIKNLLIDKNLINKFENIMKVNNN